MERLGRRLSEAAAALAKLDELAGKNERSYGRLVKSSSPPLKISVPHRQTQRFARRVIWDGFRTRMRGPQ